MPHPTRQAFVRWVAAVLLTFVVVYPLSYAPVVKWQAAREYEFVTRRDPPLIDESTRRIYKPIDWLIDNTPLDKPLFLWAHLSGVEDYFQSSAFWRSLVRDIRPRYGRINL